MLPILAQPTHVTLCEPLIFCYPAVIPRDLKEWVDGGLQLLLFFLIGNVLRGPNNPRSSRVSFSLFKIKMREHDCVSPKNCTFCTLVCSFPSLMIQSGPTFFHSFVDFSDKELKCVGGFVEKRLRRAEISFLARHHRRRRDDLFNWANRGLRTVFPYSPRG